jgi:hypothetical protein
MVLPPLDQVVGDIQVYSAVYSARECSATLGDLAFV